MGEMKLYSEGLLSITGVSNIFLDEYMPQANGEFVKVYLYLLRCMADASKKCTVCAIADYFNQTEKDICRALLYWQRENVIHIDFDENKRPVGICMLPLYSRANGAAAPEIAPTLNIEPSAEKAVNIIGDGVPEEPAATSVAAMAPVEAEPVRREFTLDEIESYRNDPEIEELFHVVESLMRKPLKHSDYEDMLFWHVNLGFSTDLIIHLVEYCVDKGHYSFRYMDRIALDWHKDGIFTIEEAIEDAKNHNELHRTVIKALGISGRDLAQTEIGFISRWTDEWHFELPLIKEACRRTIEATHQPSFPYTDKVLETWRKNGVKNLDDVSALDANFAKNRKISVNTTDYSKNNKFHNFEQRHYDYDQLQKILIQKPI